MSINSVFSSGLQGVQAGMNRVNQAGGRIAIGPVDAGELAQPMVDLKIGEHQVGMSANVIKAADEMIGTLIDIKA